jgi:probable rRNA maturation factor
VISFDLGDEPGPAGELYVSLECALRVAQARGLDQAGEVLLYVVHGALHLCGFDDHDPRDRARMRKAEARVLARLAQRAPRSPKSLSARTRPVAQRKKPRAR